MGQVSELPI